MFIADRPHDELGKTIGNGHCVAFCRHVTTAPHTSRWAPGVKARGDSVPGGAIIATFHPHNRVYENDTTGRSHCAVFLREEAEGLRVLDQWVGHPVAERTIRFKGGAQPHADDGDAYYVVEEAHGVG